MSDYDEKVVGPGHITSGQVNAAVDNKVNAVLDDSKNQLDSGCLVNVPKTDQTEFMSKKETIFYIDTDAMRSAGSLIQAHNIEAQKNVMLDARLAANKAFDSALKLVDQDTGVKAVQVLNHAKEAIYYNNFNNYHHQADHSAMGINSQSELELSWVKAKLATQLADGSFKREMDARELSGPSLVCEDNSLVR